MKYIFEVGTAYGVSNVVVDESFPADCGDRLPIVFSLEVRQDFGLRWLLQCHDLEVQICVRWP